MRRRKAELPAIPDELPKLSPRELKFVIAILRDGCNQTEALQHAVPASRKWKPGVRWTHASKMAARPNVREALAAGRRAGIAAAASSLGSYLTKVQQREQQAADAGEFTAVSRLIELEGKALGYVGKEHVRQQDVLGGMDLVIAVRGRWGAEAGRKVALAMGELEAITAIDGECETVETQAESDG